MKLLLNIAILLSLGGLTARSETSIATMDPDGGRRQLMAVVPQDNIEGLDWTPDMTRFVYNSKNTGVAEVYEFDRGTQYACQLTNYGGSWGQWAGRYDSTGEIWYRHTNASGSYFEIRRIERELCEVLSEDSLFNHPGWELAVFDLSPNYIAINKGGPASTEEIYIAPLANLANLTQLTSNSLPDRAPDISRDESKIVYVRGFGSNTSQNIFTMNIDGSDTTQLTFEPDVSPDISLIHFPQWSDDGTQIGYTYWNGSQHDIYVINADGTGEPLNITNTPSENEELWDWRDGRLLYTTDGEFSIVQLPTTTYGPCDTDQPVVASLSKPAGGATVTLKIPDGVEVADISREGLLTEDWDFVTEIINTDSAYLLVNLVNTFGEWIPADTTTLFYVEFTTSRLCEESKSIHWDTALSDDPSRSTRLFDTTGTIRIYPYFDGSADSTEILGYLPGDAFGDPSLDLNDLIGTTNFLYLGGARPCVIDAADVNGDCLVDLGDLIYLVNYLFVNGPEPQCGCVSTGEPLARKVSSQVSANASYREGWTVVTLSSEIDLRGIQLKVVGSDAGQPEALVDCGWNLIAGRDESGYRVGMLDLDGGDVLPAGSATLIRIPGEYEIESALVADHSGHVFSVQIGTATIESSLPTSFALAQNYPNPFNPSTEISFSLPNASDVRLEVFNVLGQSVAILVDGRVEAGTHSVRWDASNSASGVYLYRIQAGEFTDTRKMMLLK
ncbi:MAG: T9SS type A sorting domain-containing protein [candidate division Zixibacteria bacterium]|nr:T9SS type A sorting domain-containing protein [candidate division Zixibacteria bacterium]